MSTPKKERKGKTSITCDLLEKINELHILGLSTKKIAPLLNIGESTAKRYVTVLDAINNGTDFNLAGDFCWKAITDYCVKRKVLMPANLHGLPEPEPKKVDFMIPEPPEFNLPAILEDIASALYALAEYIKNHKED